MGLHLPHMLAFIVLILGSHAALALPLLPSQVYSNSVLPNTPMPKAVRELVQPDFMTVGKGRVFAKPDKNFILHNQDGAADNELRIYIYKQDADADNRRVNYKDDAATDNQILGDPTRVLFFLEKDIRTAGTTMKYHLIGNSTRATFLSRKTADSIPFSSSKLPEILSQFSLKPGSVEADIIKETIHLCEGPATKGEEKYCATSLESMIDFITSKLGRKNIQAISTDVKKGGPLLQNYTITPGLKKVTENKLIACHKMSYPYAVFYCHAFEKTRAYLVPLKDAEGTKAEAIAVCHVDTSEWSAKHLAFRELKVKPGTVPVCHFLKDDEIAWVPK